MPHVSDVFMLVNVGALISHIDFFNRFIVICQNSLAVPQNLKLARRTE